MSYRRLAEALLCGQPYFGYAMRALQGLPDRHRYFLPIVKAAASSQALAILEVGSWAGASAVSWASALRKMNLAGTVTCVDSWVPYFDATKEKSLHYQHMNRAASHGMIRKLFDHNVAASGFSETIVARTGPSSAILPALPPQVFDIVYLDGSHAFEDVVSDARQAARLIRPGGVICGDDLEAQLEDLDLEEAQDAARKGLDFVASRSGVEYHPGVTAAVAQEFGTVCSWNGFWALRFTENGPVPIEIDTAGCELPEHVIGSALELVEETCGYYLIRSGDRYLAMAREAGPPDLQAETLGDEDLPPLVFTGETLDQVRGKLRGLQDARDTSTPESSGIPLLVGSHKLFNLVRFGSSVYGLRQSLGEIHLNDIDLAKGLTGQFSPDDLVIGKTSQEVIARIDAVEAERALRELTIELEQLARRYGG